MPKQTSPRKKASKPSSKQAPPSKQAPRPRKPSRHVLYELAVQQPWVTVNWLVNMYTAMHQGRWPEHLREDFAGAAAIAIAWVQHDHQHTAVAVERDKHPFDSAIRSAARLAKTGELDQARLKILRDDVMTAYGRATKQKAGQPGPRPQIVTATNFSINYFHQRQELLAYFAAVRKTLAPQGLLVMDTYQGPGAWRCTSQQRPIHPPAETGVEPFTYTWRQVSVNHVTGLVKCAIDFTFADKHTMRNAFVYDWRLWSIAELTDALHEAGFDEVEIWHDAQGDGQLEPVTSIDDEEDIVAYIVAKRSS